MSQAKLIWNLAVLVVVAAISARVAACRKLADHGTSALVKENFHPSRVHFVDRVGQNALFRGNEPIADGSDTFSYQIVVEEIKKKALSEANWALEDPFFLVDLSFEFIEYKDINREKEFFEKNPRLGKYVEWSLFGSPFPPSSVSSSLRKYLAKGPIWKFDQLPKRLPELRSMLENQGAIPLIVYAHCEAGCDRTGEFIASYLMQFKNYTIEQSWESDTVSCGREPYHVNQYSMEWYCEYLKLKGDDHLDSCTIQRS